MTEQYKIRRNERLANSLPFFFKEFSGFQIGALRNIDKEILRLTQRGRFEAASNVCLHWIPKVRNALLYFHRYQRFSLGIAIVALYLTWNLALFLFITRFFLVFLLMQLC